MKCLPVIVLFALVAVSSSSLLEMSQVLWSRILGGSYHRIGKLDPLYIPVVKVNQSEGNMSYRVILRNLEVTGLNASKIESVHMVRGSLKSNLSDNEAGYVSHNQQRGLDSIRYRFHTLIKEPRLRDRDASPSGTFEDVIEYNPASSRVGEEADMLGISVQNGQRRRVYTSADAAQDGRENSQYQQGFDDMVIQPNYGNMRVAVNPTERNPSSVRVVYTPNYAVYNSNSRPCIGACRSEFQGYTSNPAVPQSYVQYVQYAPGEIPRIQARVYHDQQYNPGQYGNPEESSTGGYSMQANFGGADRQRQNQFSVKGGGFSGSYGNGQFSVGNQDGQNQPGVKQPHNQFSVKGGGNSGPSYSGNYDNGRFSVQGQNGENSAPNRQPENQFSVKGGQSRPVYSGNYGNGQFSARGQTGPYRQQPDEFSVKGGRGSGASFSGNFRDGQISVQSNGGENYGQNGQRQNQFSVKGGNPGSSPYAGEVKGSPSSNYEVKAQQGETSFSAGNSGIKGSSASGTRYSADFKNGQFSINSGSQTSEPRQTSYQPEQRNRFAEQSTSSFVEFEPYKSPMIRLEKQPSYVDIVYATKKDRPQFEQLRVAPTDDPRIEGFEDIVKEINANTQYNFTSGESLIRQNDAVRVAAETRRIKDMIRYAKEYQEKQGYYEEGMELIYHFGNVNNGSKANETQTRTKRQHANDKDEEDVMHVVVRVRVPMLSVKSNYALTGKVGKRQLRGNGLLAGNFTDVVADFTVELKQVDNKTMVVRAARAKIVSKDRKVRLQGMDETGPIESILNHGLMAAEAVAAMVADDLATKALSEGSDDGMIYKMYKNLPVAEKAN